MTPGVRSKFDASMFELEIFRKQVTVVKKVNVTLLGLFGALRSDSAPKELFPLSPLVTPLHCPHDF